MPKIICFHNENSPEDQDYILGLGPDGGRNCIWILIFSYCPDYNLSKQNVLDKWKYKTSFT